MSNPWADALTWFPFEEDTIAAADIGTGTDYPVTWGRTDGSTTSDQMCQFEWTTKTVRRRADGVATVTVFDTTGTMSVQGTISFSFDQSVTPDSGTDWSVLEPSDLTVGGRAFTFTDDTATGIIVTPWAGPVTITIRFLGGSIDGLYGVLGSDSGGDGNFTQYVKQLRNFIQAEGASIPHYASTNPSSMGVGSTPTGFSATLFHGGDMVWQLVPLASPTDGFSFTRFSYEVTDNFTAPANI